MEKKLFRLVVGIIIGTLFLQAFVIGLYFFLDSEIYYFNVRMLYKVEITETNISSAHISFPLLVIKETSESIVQSEEDFNIIEGRGNISLGYDPKGEPSTIELVTDSCFVVSFVYKSLIKEYRFQKGMIPTTFTGVVEDDTGSIEIIANQSKVTFSVYFEQDSNYFHDENSWEQLLSESMSYKGKSRYSIFSCGKERADKIISGTKLA